MASFQDALAEACGGLSLAEVAPEVLSDVVEAIWSAPDVPPAVQDWLRAEGRAARERNGRRERRRSARNIPLPAEKGDDRAADPAAIVEAKDLVAAISLDEFDRQVVDACCGEHPLYEDFGEFACSQSVYSTAHVYKRREKVRWRLIAIQNP